jgi:hypothetical protein
VEPKFDQTEEEYTRVIQLAVLIGEATGQEPLDLIRTHSRCTRWFYVSLTLGILANCALTYGFHLTGLRNLWVSLLVPMIIVTVIGRYLPLRLYRIELKPPPKLPNPPV